MCGYESMLKLNFSNVEELIFYDTTIQNKLPSHMFSIFEQWRLSKRVSYLREIGKRALLDFLNQLNDSDLPILENYFGEKIIIERLNYDIVQNIKLPLSEVGICAELCNTEGFSNFSTWRDNEHLYISFWR